MELPVGRAAEVPVGRAIELLAAGASALAWSEWHVLHPVIESHQ